MELLYTPPGMYGPCQLYKNQTTDEAGHQIIEYKDKMGQLMLKKVRFAASPGTAHVGWLCTYYTYDDVNLLRFVVQPRAVELINSNWTLSQGIADELCFGYEYDAGDRNIIKRIPGAGKLWMVYDVMDRLVMTQDSALRLSTAKWMVTEYDAINRPYRTGLLTDANNRVYHQNLAGSSNVYPNTSANYEVMNQAFFDDYSWVSGWLKYVIRFCLHKSKHL